MKHSFYNRKYNYRLTIDGIGSAWILTLANYFLVGYFDDTLDGYYLPSFNVLFTTIIVFTILSNISFAIFRYRLRQATLWSAFYENICWIPFFAIFFSGLSFHVSIALLAHMFGVNMTWISTAKELENSNFFKEGKSFFLLTFNVRLIPKIFT